MLKKWCVSFWQQYAFITKIIVDAKECENIVCEWNPAKQLRFLLWHKCNLAFDAFSLWTSFAIWMHASIFGSSLFFIVSWWDQLCGTSVFFSFLDYRDLRLCSHHTLYKSIMSLQVLTYNYLTGSLDCFFYRTPKKLLAHMQIVNTKQKIGNAAFGVCWVSSFP